VGYKYPGDLAKNYDYYIKRVTHESSLSMPIYAAVAALIGRWRDALTLFRESLKVDLENLYGNTQDGFHVATAGGLWWAVLHGFLGIRLEDGKIVVPDSTAESVIKVLKYSPLRTQKS